MRAPEITARALRARRKNLPLIALTALLLLGLGIEEPRAQAQSIESDITIKLQIDPTFGILMFKLTLWDLETNQEDFCAQRQAHFTGPDGITWRARTFVGRLGQPPTMQDTIALLAPGTYVLDAISCETPYARNRLKGQFATFTINTGEVISGGHLIVQFRKNSTPRAKTFKSRQQVKDLDPATIASLKQQLPVTSAKAIKRNMIPINKPGGT